MTSKIKETRLEAGFSRPDIFRLMGIPVRTQEDRESGKRNPPKWAESLVINEIKRLKEFNLDNK